MRIRIKFVPKLNGFIVQRRRKFWFWQTEKNKNTETVMVPDNCWQNPGLEERIITYYTPIVFKDFKAATVYVLGLLETL